MGLEASVISPILRAATLGRKASGRHPTRAIASISTRAPLGSATAWIVARAGLWAPKWRAEISFIAREAGQATQQTGGFPTHPQVRPATPQPPARDLRNRPARPAVVPPTPSSAL